MFEVIPVVNRDGYCAEARKSNYYRNSFEELRRECEEGQYTTELHYEHMRKAAMLEAEECSIATAVKAINNKFVLIGSYLIRIDDERLYSVVYSGVSDKYCEDIFRYAFVRFGLKKTTTFMLMAVAKNFGEHGYLKDQWKPYSFSQLCEILPMSEELRAKVRPDMTVKQLRELKSTANVLAMSENAILTSESDEGIQTSEFSDCADPMLSKLAELLEEGDNYHLWTNGKKIFIDLARWLISKGVKVKL